MDDFDERGAWRFGGEEHLSSPGLEWVCLGRLAPPHWGALARPAPESGGPASELRAAAAAAASAPPSLARVMNAAAFARPSALLEVSAGQLACAARRWELC